MKRFNFIIVAIVLFLLASMPLTGAILRPETNPVPYASLSEGDTNAFYVAPNGQNTNDGSISSPFKTIQHAADLAQAGDTVYIREGTYNEIVSVANSGTASAPITFANYTGESVIIDGTDITHSKALFNFNGKSYVVLDGIKVVNSSRYGIGFSGARGGSHITVQNCSTYNTVSAGIGFQNSSYIIITGNLIENASNTGIYEEALSINSTSYFEISYNQVLDSYREGINVKNGSSHGAVHHNTCRGSSLFNPAEGRPGLYIDGFSKAQTDIEIYDNIVYHCANGIFIACEASGSLNDVKVYNNLCYNNSGWGLALSIEHDNYGTISNVHYYNNTTYDNGSTGTAGGGIYLSNKGYKASNIKISDNIFAEFRSSDLCIPICGASVINSDSANFTIENNLIQKNAGWNSYAGSGAIIADPLFVAPANADFNLKSNSPALAIDAGYRNR